jgi:hypothetical protein
VAVQSDDEGPLLQPCELVTFVIEHSRVDPNKQRDDASTVNHRVGLTRSLSNNVMSGLRPTRGLVHDVEILLRK